MLRRRRQLLQRQLARGQRALQEVVDPTLQSQEPVHRVRDCAALHAAKLLLAAQHALQRLVRPRSLAADFLIDLQHRHADELCPHGALLGRGRTWCQP